MINYFVFPCVSVAFALRDAVKASREEFGLEGDQGIPGWIHLCKDMIMFCIIQQSDNLIQYIYAIHGPVNILFWLLIEDSTGSFCGTKGQKSILIK